ncbi:MAG: histidinol dehydrogenase [Pseudomonadota bacterium]
MALRLSQKQADFSARFDELLSQKREASSDVSSTVRSILSDVASRGDEAVLEYTATFDRLEISAEEIRITPEEIHNARSTVEDKTIEALQLAHDRIFAHHSRQLPKDDRYTDALGVELGSRWTAVESIGLYVPGGTASYPSSVLMNAVPAKVAGVERIVMVVPTPDGEIQPLVLVAADMAGVDEIYRIGGAQAVAALAYGTNTIDPVVKIVGPGNAFVAEAKRQVFGTVGIDMIAGPSEVLIIADHENDPDWVAADLLAQAEHDTAAQSILITNNETFATQVELCVKNQLKTLPRSEIATKSWEDFGAIITVDDIKESAALANKIAAEHLEIMTANPDDIFEKIHNAGAVFLGRYTPEAIGDYVGGSNHVLPTSRSARFSSGLSVLDYMKRTSILRCGSEQLQAIGGAAQRLAEVEGLEAHRKSVAIRGNANK